MLVYIIIINRNKLMYPNTWTTYDRHRGSLLYSTAPQKKNMEVSSSCLETKMKFISGKIMKRHYHHHHHRQYNPKNDKHCIYTYKTLCQQRTQNVQRHV